MKQQVRISYRSSGLRAPVFIVSSLSEPQWEPKELHSTVLDDGELEFWRVFEAEEGEYQYKFRLGPGDWWALDETKTVVDDGKGNRNNIITVEAPKASSPRSPAVDGTRPAELSPRPSSDHSRRSSRSSGLGISNEHDGRNSFADTKQQIQQAHLVAGAPLTPPMTPEMTLQSAVVEQGKFQPFPAVEIQRPASVASHYSDKSVEEGLAAIDETEAVQTIEPEKTPAHQQQQQQRGILSSVKLFLITLGTWMMNLAGGSLRLTGLLAIAVGLAAIVYKIRDLKDTLIPGILSLIFPSYARRNNGTDDSSMV